MKKSLRKICWLSLFLSCLFFGNLGSNADLSSFNPSFIADIAEKAAPSVVSLEISVKGRRRIREVSDTIDFGGMKLYKGRPKVVSFETKAGDGSGFIISPDGYIVTNQHLLVLNIGQQKVRASKVEVVLYNGRKYLAEIVGEDEDSDIAVLKIKAKNLKPIRWANSSKARPGEFALTIGSSLGADHTVGFGIISAVSRKKPQAQVIEALTGELEYIQTYAQINPGNSGGPLINLDGEVLGITSFIQLAPHSPGFAIPANYAKKIVASLIADGRVRRPAVGLYLLSVRPNSYKDIPEGAFVKDLLKDGPADQAGIQPGDIITKINQTIVKTQVDFTRIIRASPVNTSFKLELYRNGKRKTITLTSKYLD